MNRRKVESSRREYANMREESKSSHIRYYTGPRVIGYKNSVLLQIIKDCVLL